MWSQPSELPGTEDMRHLHGKAKLINEIMQLIISSLKSLSSLYLEKKKDGFIFMDLIMVMDVKGYTHITKKISCTFFFFFVRRRIVKKMEQVLCRHAVKWNHGLKGLSPRTPNFISSIKWAEEIAALPNFFRPINR